jgi:RNA polymerase sigma-70 factor (TIGR02960 family)
VVTTELIARARSGDGEAFRQLIGPHRRELMVHCYRILGSTQDAEDALQETLLAAWQGLRGFEERASVRSWLYRIATSRCLNALRAGSRRPRAGSPPYGVAPLEPTGLGEVTWLEPFPDALLEGLAGHAPGPEVRYESREAISLAFVTALQLLPPRQRAVLILRDVLGFRAAEVAGILESTVESVISALKRARAGLSRQFGPAARREPPPAPGSPAEQQLVRQLTLAFESGAVHDVVALLTEDALLSIPPLPLEYQGRELARRFFTAIWGNRSYRLIAARANDQPAFALYVRDPQARVAHASGLLVATLAGPQICVLTRFDNSVLPGFGLPRTLPD